MDRLRTHPQHMISESIKDKPGLFSYMVSGSKPVRLRWYIAISLVDLQRSGRGVCSYMVSGSAMDRTGLYPAIWLVGLQWTSRGHILQ